MRRYPEVGSALPTAFALTAVLIYAANAIVSKLAVGVIEPSAIAFYRWLFAGLLLAPFLGKSAWKERARLGRLLPKLFVQGMLGMVAYQCLGYVAAQTISATNMGILVAMVPLMAVLLDSAFFGAPMTKGCVSGGLLSLVGVGYLLTHGHLSELMQRPGAGDALMLLAALSYAGYSVLLKKWSGNIDIRHSLLMQIWSVIPVLFAYYLSQGAPKVTRQGFPLLLFAAVPASILAPFLWMKGVTLLGSSRAAALMNFLPLFVVLIAVLMLREKLYLFHFVGGATIFLGVLLAQQWTTPL